MSSRRLRLRWVGVGDESEDFLREAAKVAEHCRRGVGDLTRWSAMICVYLDYTYYINILEDAYGC